MNTTMDKVATSTLTQLIARGAMVLALPIIIWIATYVQGLGTDVAGVQLRVNTLETRIQIGQQQREQFQARVEKQLEDLDKRSISILQSLARLEKNNP